MESLLSFLLQKVLRFNSFQLSTALLAFSILTLEPLIIKIFYCSWLKCFLSVFSSSIHIFFEEFSDSIFVGFFIIALTETVMIVCPEKKCTQPRKKSITSVTSQHQQKCSTAAKTPSNQRERHNHPEIFPESDVNERKSEQIIERSNLSCQNYFLRKTILVLYNFFQKMNKSWNLDRLSYKNMISILKELRYVKSIDVDTVLQQNQEIKKCYYLWVNLAQGRHVCLGNLIIVLCYIQHLEMDVEIIKEVVVQLQKGISKFEEEMDQNGNPNFIFLCKRQGWTFQDNFIQMNQKQIKSLRKELQSFKYTRLTENELKIEYSENYQESNEAHFMSKKSIELASNKRQKILQEIRQKQTKIETIELHHILNYKQQKVKFTVSKIEECEAPSEEKAIRKEPKVEKKNSKGAIKEKKKNVKNTQKNTIKMNSNKENRNANHQKIKSSKQKTTLEPSSSEFSNVMVEDLGLSEITKTQIIEEIQFIDNIPEEGNNSENFNNNDFFSNFLPQSLILPESQAQKKRREYIDIPILYVDVNIEDGKKERIIVYDGDTAQDLAHEFGRKHGLCQETIERLVVMLKQQIGSVLCKIDEALEEDCSYLY